MKKSLGLSIRLARVERRMRQDDLAERCNVSEPYISLIENDKRLPTLKLLRWIAKVLRVKVSTLMLNAGE